MGSFCRLVIPCFSARFEIGRDGKKFSWVFWIFELHIKEIIETGVERILKTEENPGKSVLFDLIQPD